MVNASNACVRAAPLPSTVLAKPGSVALPTRGRSSSIGPLIVLTVVGS
jgi:hypothetical protein